MLRAPRAFEVAALAVCASVVYSRCRTVEPPVVTPPDATGGVSTGGQPSQAGTGGWEPFPTGGQASTVKCESREAKARREVRRADLDRVVNGRPAKKGQFPFVASMQVPWSQGLSAHYCTGSLLSRSVVQTAGHCSPDVGDRVVIDRVDLRQTDGQSRYVAEVRTHARFVDVEQGFDVALVKLDDPVEISPVLLPTAGDSFDGLTATVMGWGRTSDGGPLAPVLQFAAVPLVDRQDCLLKYPELPETAMCAGFEQGGTDTCNGDSGGPIAVQLGAGWTLAGGTSYGFRCAVTYGVYLDELNEQILGWVGACLGELE